VDVYKSRFGSIDERGFNGREKKKVILIRVKYVEVPINIIFFDKEVPTNI